MTITLTEHDDGASIRARVGDTIEIHLPENATTRYRSELDELDERVFDLTEAGTDYPSKAIGSGGEAWSGSACARRATRRCASSIGGSGRVPSRRMRRRPRTSSRMSMVSPSTTFSTSAVVDTG
jgi:hypothetical protein